MSLIEIINKEPAIIVNDSCDAEETSMPKKDVVLETINKMEQIRQQVASIDRQLIPKPKIPTKPINYSLMYNSPRIVHMYGRNSMMSTPMYKEYHQQLEKISPEAFSWLAYYHMPPVVSRNILPPKPEKIEESNSEEEDNNEDDSKSDDDDSDSDDDSDRDDDDSVETVTDKQNDAKRNECKNEDRKTTIMNNYSNDGIINKKRKASEEEIDKDSEDSDEEMYMMSKRRKL